MRKRAERFAPIPHTNSPYHLPELGKKLASKANRAGVEEPFPDPRVRKTLEVAVSLINPYDHLWGEGELSLTRTAKAQDVPTFSRRHSVPGSGQILALVIWYAIQDLARFPRGQDFVSYCRVVQGAKASGGKRLGTSGTKIGTGPRRWAFAEAAVLFLRHHQPGKEYFTTLAHQHGTATALTVLAHKLGRAVYDRLSREQAVARQRFVSA